MLRSFDGFPSAYPSAPSVPSAVKIRRIQPPRTQGTHRNTRRAQLHAAPSCTFPFQALSFRRPASSN
jgi:hypothetical protein